MELWGYTVTSAVEWLIFAVLLVLALVIYFAFVVFVRRYTTGIMGGFILALLGLALMIWPAYHLIFYESNFAQMILSGLAIAVGFITMAVAAYKLTNFWDF